MVTPLHIRPKQEEIYLDCNATTPVLEDIAATVTHVMEAVFGNPSSTHTTGLQARYILESTRQLGRQLVGAQQGHLLFTSGATEGIQTAVLSALSHAKSQPNSGRWLLYGATEHKAVPQALAHWQQVLGCETELKAIPVDANGLLDQQFIADHVADAAMICTMAVNNETGVKQDLSALECVIREHNPTVPWLVDCVQVLGKQALDLNATSIDYAPFSGHKLYAPKGIGFLYVREGAPYTPLLIGGGQESGLRSGTENLPGIAALHRLFELLLAPQEGGFHDPSTLEQFRQQLLQALQRAFPSLELNHSLEHSVPTTLNFSVRGLSSRDIMDVFDAANIRVSSGSACSSGVSRSFVLDAMGAPDWRSQSAIRLSFGPATQAETIAQACQRIEEAARALRQSCLLLVDTQEDIDSELDGVVQLRFDQQCCYLIIDKAARELVVIDPVPELAERIQRLVQCQHYHVQAILSTQPSTEGSARAMLAAVLDTELGDAVGWPLALNQSLQIGSASIRRMGTRLPVYELSQASRKFVFVGEEPELHTLESWVSEDSLILAARDPQFEVAWQLLELRGESLPCELIDVSLEQQQEWLRRPDTLVIDVREQQEHQLNPLPLANEVKNVPLPRLAQFIADHRSTYQERPIVCICRSGQRSAVAARALNRNGFCQVSHLLGGTALLQG
ncbi:aminotransferase class V-fold PLP-dependent enzyme [Pseudidiomarina taiwanensis]|uniref:cysteine desulfurase n=1 Tax=Pseudidiomarina taiwanensis TaxID=337250 RepID=A0A432ZK33_9GAMM|nr:aminotransferase class V-fold PLP-dependent enzyme [Pseudidiomarina taiwanensis]RUO78299.1 aminotransferase class V [Pseudidiomarina taiwanensis]